MIKFIREILRRRKATKKVILLMDFMTCDQVKSLMSWMRNNGKNSVQILEYIESGALDEVSK